MTRTERALRHANKLMERLKAVDDNEGTLQIISKHAAEQEKTK